MPDIKIEIETREGAKVNLSVGTDGLSPDHLAAVLSVVRQVSHCDVPVVSAQPQQAPKPEQPAPAQPEPELETDAFDLRSTPPELWYKVSAWAKSTGNLYPKQRAIAYTIGSRVTAGNTVSRKQYWSGRNILVESKKRGFDHPALDEALASMSEPADKPERRLTISDDNKNRKFTLNYRLQKLPEADREKIRISRAVVVGMLKSLIATDFDYYCKYSRGRLDQDEVGMFMSTNREWSGVFKKFNIIDRNLDDRETTRLTKIVLKMLVSRQYSLEADCPTHDGGRVHRKVVTQLCKRKNSDGETIYVFAVKTGGAEVVHLERKPDLVGISALHGQRGSA